MSDEYRLRSLHSLTPEEHIDKAERALEAAKGVAEENANKYANKAASTEALLAHAEYLDLMQIVNVHANLASAKTLLVISQSNLSIVKIEHINPDRYSGGGTDGT